MRVPLASGLGSSSSAAVAGLLGANELLGKPSTAAACSSWPPTSRATPTMSRRPCSAASPSSCRRATRLLTKKILVPEVHVALAVPDLPSRTRSARAGLPEQVTMKDAVFNLQRTPLVVEALRTGDFELLGQVMEDRLHQSNRMQLIQGGREAWVAAQKAGAAAIAVSGSGPSLIAFVSLATDALMVARAMTDAFAAAGVAARPLGLSTSAAGATVVA